MRYIVAALALLVFTVPVWSQESVRISPGIAPSLPQAGPEVPQIQDSQKTINIPHRTVNGEVLIMERDYLVVKERSGIETRLALTPEVPGARGVHVGDWVLAQVSPGGDISILKTQTRPKYRSHQESSGGASGGERGFPFGR